MVFAGLVRELLNRRCSLRVLKSALHCKIEAGECECAVRLQAMKRYLFGSRESLAVVLQVSRAAVSNETRGDGERHLLHGHGARCSTHFWKIINVLAWDWAPQAPKTRPENACLLTLHLVLGQSLLLAKTLYPLQIWQDHVLSHSQHSIKWC